MADILDVYVDPDSGKEYTLDTLPDKFKSVVDQARPESSTLDTLGNSAKSGYYNFLANTLGGLGQAFGDSLSNIGDTSPSFLDSLPIPDSFKARGRENLQRTFDNSASKLGLDIPAIESYGSGLSSNSKALRDLYSNQAQDAQDNIAIDTSTNSGSILDFIQKGIPTASKTLGAALPAILTKNPGLLGPSLTGTFVGEGLGQDYGQARDAGLTPGQATALAGERAIPNYIQSKFLNPIGAGGVIKNAATNLGSNLAGSALDLTNRSLTDQAFINSEGVSVGKTYEDLKAGIEQGASDAFLGTVSAHVAGRLANRGARPIPNDVNKTLEGELTDIAKDPLHTPELDAQLTPIEEPLDLVKPVEKKPVINQTEDTKVVPDALGKKAPEEAQTKVFKAEDKPVELDSPDVVVQEEVSQVNALMDEVFDPVKNPTPEDAASEKVLNEKIKEVNDYNEKVAQISEPLRPLVERKLVDSDKALAVSKSIPESNPVLGNDAKALQVDFIQRANVENLSSENISALANDTSNLHAASKALDLKTPSVDLLNKLQAYRNEINAFDEKIGGKKAYKRGVDTNLYKRAIQDEVAQSIDPFTDAGLLQALDATDPKDIPRLVKDRILAKDKGAVESYGDQTQGSFFDIINNEKGAINPNLFGYNIFKDNLQKVKANFSRMNSADVLHKEMMDNIHQQVLDVLDGQEIMPGAKIERTSRAIEDFANGKIKTLEGIVPKAVLKPIERMAKVSREYYVQPQKLVALDVPGGDLKKVFDTTHRKIQETAIQKNQLLSELSDYADLIDKTSVNRILIQRNKIAQDKYRQGKRVSFPDSEYQKLGATPDDIAAIKSWDKTTAQAWKMVGYHMKNFINKSISDPAELAQSSKAIDEWIKAKETTYYIPQTRKGDWAVHAEHQKSDAIPNFYNRYKTEAEALKVAEDLRKSGFDSRTYEWKPPTEAAYALAPEDLLLDVNNLIKGETSDNGKGTSIKGFKSHLLQAQNDTLGAPTDLFKGILDYIDGASSMAMEWKYDPTIKGLLKQDKYKNSEAANQLYKWYDYTKTNNPEGRIIRQIVAQHTLGFLQPSSSLLNALSPFTSTAPELAKIVKTPGSAYPSLIKASGQYADYILRPEAFKKKNPKLYSTLQYAERIGETGGNVMKFYGTDQSLGAGALKKFSETSMLLQRASEGMNRGSAIIAAYNNAPKGVNKVQFAIDFSKHVNVDYSKGNRPKRARGAFGATTYAMKLYGHNYLSNLMATVRGVGGEAVNVAKGKKGSIGKLGRNAESLGYYLAPLSLIGGVKALPGVPQAVNIATSKGIDLEEMAKDFIGDPSWSNQILNGLPLQWFGGSLTGASAPTAGLDWERDLANTLASGIGGPAWDLAVTKPARVYQGYKTQGAERALQEALPRGLARPYESYRASKDVRGFTDIYGRSIGRNANDQPSTKDLLINATGIQPEFKVTRRTEDNSLRIIEQREVAKAEGLNNRIGNLWFDIINAKRSGDSDAIKSANEKMKQELIAAMNRGVDTEKIAKKAIGPDAAKNIMKMLSMPYREIDSAPKDVKMEMIQQVQKNRQREEQMKRQNEDSFLKNLTSK